MFQNTRTLAFAQKAYTKTKLTSFAQQTVQRGILPLQQRCFTPQTSDHLKKTPIPTQKEREDVKPKSAPKPQAVQQSSEETQAWKKKMNSTQVDFEYLKPEHSNTSQDRNYQLLITDCNYSVHFLNKLPLSILNESIQVFRNNIFSMQDRKQIPHLLYQILEREYIVDEALPVEDQKQSDDRQTVSELFGSNVDPQKIFETSKEIYQSLQVVLEFMDKGVKGLLSGDLSVSLIKQIEISIGRYEQKFKKLSLQIQNQLDKQETLDRFLQTHFQIQNLGSEQNVYQQNIPKYNNMLHNFQNFMVTLDRKDWQNQIKLKEQTNYFNSQSSTVSINNQVKAVHFSSPQNMQMFINQRAENVKGESQDKMSELKREMNSIINALYEEIATFAFSMDRYRVPVNGIDQADYENPLNLFQRQLKIEQLSFELAHEKYKKQLTDLIKIGRADQLASSHRYILQWMRTLETTISEQQKIFIKRGNIESNKIGYYLMALPADQIATLCILYLMRHLFTEFVNDIHKEAENKATQHTQVNITQEVKIPAIELFDQLGRLFDKELKTRLTKVKSTKKQTDDSIERHLIIDDHEIGTMNRNMQLKVGAFLTNLMCKNLKYQIGNQSYLLLEPQVIREQFPSKGGSKKYMGYVKFNKAFIEDFIGQLDKIHDLNLQIERSLPMLYPPAPWKNFYFGGYYLKQTKMAKVAPQFKEAVKYLSRADMKPLCNVLDILGSVPWQLNTKVLDIMEYVWSIGGGLGEVPKRFNERVISPEMIKDAPFREKLKLLKEHQHNKESHGLRCEWLLRLSIAQSFKTCEKIYFPHNCDFRGRVYPVPPHLNHMGPDINRGMLNFSEGKRLGKEGLWWLKVHLANKFGKDKLPLVERAQYSESILDTVHRIADDPRNNLEWLQADSPWQSLATCFELSAAMRMENPEDYICHLHVHVDGSCNGMQHYAAFGRDEQGGRQVNLAESERPGDVYTAILKLVIQDLERETNPDYIEIAESLKGKVQRKVIKQTVMTSVYGVTFIGARAQIQRQLKERKLFDTNGELYRAANYLAKVTIKCIGDLFSDANQIKDWFAKCAKVVANTGEPVKWRSPLGLPCVQPYKYVSSTSVITTILQKLTIADNLDDQPVNKSKNTTAFPPNFVHSIDSTHMMLTALNCQEDRITFAAVHDSYWTHPSDVTRMNKILRQQFVDLHSSPLITSLNENFESRYPHEKFPEVPKQGSFNLNSVKDSTYFFS